MIEHLIAEMINDLGIDNYPVEAPQNTKGTFIVWNVSGFNSLKNTSKDQHHKVNIQFNIYAKSYKETKSIQYKLVDVFEYLHGSVERQNATYEVIGNLENVVDLFDTDMKQIVVDIQMEYYKK